MAAKPSPSVPAARLQPLEAKMAAYHHAEQARTYYRISSVLVLAALVAVTLLKPGPVNWLIVASVSIIITVLGALTIKKGAVANGITSLLFAWVVLPSWIFIAPSFKSSAAEILQAAAKPAPPQEAVPIPEEPSIPIKKASPKAAPPLQAPTTEEQAVIDIKAWIARAVVDPEPVKYHSWKSDRRGDILTTFVEFTSHNSVGKLTQEHLKFTFDRNDPSLQFVYDEKAQELLYDRDEELRVKTELEKRRR